MIPLSTETADVVTVVVVDQLPWMTATQKLTLRLEVVRDKCVGSSGMAVDSSSAQHPIQHPIQHQAFVVCPSQGDFR